MEYKDSEKDLAGDEEGEEAEILITHDKILVESKQNLVKRKCPCIDMFDHEGPVVVRAMRNLTSGVFNHLEITSPV